MSFMQLLLEDTLVALNSRRLVGAGAAILIAAGVVFAVTQVNIDPPDAGQVGGPVKGLTSEQLRKFNEGKALFVKDFTPEEGLGPLFNGRSCYECHGKPGISGTESALMGVSSVRKIAKMRRGSPWAKKSFDEAIQGVYVIDVDPLTDRGGPALAVRSIAREFPDKYGKFFVPPGAVPPSATFVSIRHAPPLLGLGLLQAVPDETIRTTAEQQAKRAGKPMGRPGELNRPFEKEPKQGRFGWKAPHPSISSFTLEAMNNEMGLTTPLYALPKSASRPGRFPSDLLHTLPQDPNDSGATALKLAFYVALLAPPPRGPVTAQVQVGEKIFDKLGCAVCHVPSARTSDKVFLPDPDSDSAKVASRLANYAKSPSLPPDDTRYIEIKALENQTIHPYSDLLIHKMGRALADGVPEANSGGDYWRTTPLWGLRLKKFYLHDGRTSSLVDAITAHAGQAEDSVKAFNALNQQDKESLLAFLHSL